MTTTKKGTYLEGFNAGLQAQLDARNKAIAEIDSLRARLAACEEREQSLKRKLGNARRIAENVPNGYEPIEAWTNGKEIVVLGAPPEEGTPEADDHNCDAMGCSSFGPHVIHRAALKEPSRGN